jgi:hypothetical protein
MNKKAPHGAGPETASRPAEQVYIIDAESASQARRLLGKQYGEKNVVSVNQIHLDEQRIVQPTASQARTTRMQNRPHFTKQDVHTAIER